MRAHEISNAAGEQRFTNAGRALQAKEPRRSCILLAGTARVARLHGALCPRGSAHARGLARVAKNQCWQVSQASEVRTSQDLLLVTHQAAPTRIVRIEECVP